MSSIIIDSLTFEACLGVHEWEHQIPQTLTCDIEMGTDLAPAAATDDLNKTIDYAAVCLMIEQTIQQTHFKLLETAVEHLTTQIIEQYAVQWVTLYLRKEDAIVNTRSVGVRMTRQRNA